MFSFTFLCKFSCICNFGIFDQIFMKFSPKCRNKKLGMIYTILGSLCSFLNWEETIIQPQIRPRKIPVHVFSCFVTLKFRARSQQTGCHNVISMQIWFQSVFRVTRPYLNLLVKPRLFQVFWKKYYSMHFVCLI